MTNVLQPVQCFGETRNQRSRFSFRFRLLKTEYPNTTPFSLQDVHFEDTDLDTIYLQSMTVLIDRLPTTKSSTISVECIEVRMSDFRHFYLVLWKCNNPVSKMGSRVG